MPSRRNWRIPFQRFLTPFLRLTRASSESPPNQRATNKIKKGAENRSEFAEGETRGNGFTRGQVLATDAGSQVHFHHAKFFSGSSSSHSARSSPVFPQRLNHISRNGTILKVADGPPCETRSSVSHEQLNISQFMARYFGTAACARGARLIETINYSL